MRWAESKKGVESIPMEKEAGVKIFGFVKDSLVGSLEKLLVETT